MKSARLASLAVVVGVSAACARPDDGAAKKPVETQAESSAVGPEAAEPPLEPIRRAAREPSSQNLALLERSVLAPGPARLWAAFGLGKACAQDRARITSVLTTAFARALALREPPAELEVETFARALGACGTRDAEALLRSWVNPEKPLSIAGLTRGAAVGLGLLVDRLGQLEERTLTVLLDAAEREKSPLLLYAIGRMQRLAPGLAARTLDVAGDLSTRAPGPERRHALLALGSVGPSAALPLSRVIENADYSAIERATAAQVLVRLGPEGQAALDGALRVELERGLPSSATDERWLVLFSLSKSLERATSSKKLLTDLALAPLPADAPGQKRRLVLLRCRGAALVAGVVPEFPALSSCDPDHGRPEHEARLRVLDRTRLVGARASTFTSLLGNSDPLVVEAALRLLPAHKEFTGAREALVAALENPAIGVRATALQIIAAHPALALGAAKEPAPDERILQRIQSLLEPTPTPRALEATAAALGAAGALGALTLKPAVEGICDGPDRSLHARASAALGLLGSPGRSCPARLLETETKAGPTETREIRITIESDVGPLTIRLDAPDTFESRARFVSWLDSGGLARTEVGSVAPGFAVHLGDPDGDGYDGGGVAALPEEVGPTPFGPLAVSAPSFAPGAATTQLLVTVSDAPHFVGEKMLIGHASGPFHLLVPGDRLGAVRVE